MRIDPAAVVTRRGLGILSHLFLDQHFFYRQRVNRFLSAFATAPEPLGLGIDQDTVVALVDDRYGEVLG